MASSWGLESIVSYMGLRGKATDSAAKIARLALMSFNRHPSAPKPPKQAEAASVNPVLKVESSRMSASINDILFAHVGFR